MSHIGTTDFYTEVQKGNVAGHSLVHKFGRNEGVPNGSWEVVNLLGSTWPILTAATTVRVKAGAATDAAGLTGAREITVQGIDSNLAEISEAVATAGASASSATSASFWRVHRAWVSSAGNTAHNVAAVTIENSAGGTDLIQIAAEEGQTQFAAWSVPTGKTAYLLSLTAQVDSNKTANIRLFNRAGLNDWSGAQASQRLKLFFDGVEGGLSFQPRSPGSAIPALSDIWVEAFGDGAVSEVSVDFELLVVDD